MIRRGACTSPPACCSMRRVHPEPLSGSKADVRVVRDHRQRSLLFQIWLDHTIPSHRSISSCFRYSVQLLHARTLRQIILKATPAPTSRRQRPATSTPSKYPPGHLARRLAQRPPHRQLRLHDSIIGGRHRSLAARYQNEDFWRRSMTEVEDEVRNDPN
jgi:hypothetical protein